MNEEARDHVAESRVDRLLEDQGNVPGCVPSISDGDGDQARGAVSRQREWQLAHPEAARAHEALSKAVRAGAIARPGACEVCGAKCVPHGHHSDYLMPLFVAWVCDECHAGIHAMLRKRAEPSSQRAEPSSQDPLPTVPSEAAALLGARGGAAGRGASKRRNVDYAALGRKGGRPRKSC